YAPLIVRQAIRKWKCKSKIVEGFLPVNRYLVRWNFRCVPSSRRSELFDGLALLESNVVDIGFSGNMSGPAFLQHYLNVTVFVRFDFCSLMTKNISRLKLNRFFRKSTPFLKSKLPGDLYKGNCLLNPDNQALHFDSGTDRLTPRFHRPRFACPAFAQQNQTR